MANFTIPRDRLGHALQAVAPDPSTNINGTAAGTTSRITLPTGAEVVRVACINDLYFRFGDSAVNAAGTDAFMPKGAEVFRVPLVAGVRATHLAIIQHTTGGVVSVTAATD
jgi:hypothetical protein